ncbi:MAG: hypothetical protein OXQ89_20920 [Rhodospirillaceae bacterium]|nr:hypothetical protein [Rhodospirillaceae bacterium]MDE0000214.1 hypothetical protein [Rhodospirillaceae bacterium]MDE0361250.1 hypothetical protein [Rhodospirillaceae bacterium]
MPEPAFDTLEAARRLKSEGIEVEHAEAIVEVMGQSVNQLVTRDHFSAELRLTREYLDASIANLSTELHARIDGVESKLQSLESTVRAEMHAQMMRAVLIVVGVLIPAIGLMLAFVQFYSAGGGGA